jgi:hypothetical protein
MPRQVFCSECHEGFRVSSIFVERPSVTRCPYCGAPCEPAAEDLAEHPLLDPGYQPSPAGPAPIQRAA